MTKKSKREFILEKKNIYKKITTKKIIKHKIADCCNSCDTPQKLQHSVTQKKFIKSPFQG